MSFYDIQNSYNKHYYDQMLKMMGSLSNLFSESEKPYLDSRVTENIFCMCLDAENLARRDCTADAMKDGVGVGIKTWVGNGMQKVAEFNRLKKEYDGLKGEALVDKIAEFRNDRIQFTMNTYGLKEMIYHCTVRDVGVINIKESPLDLIDRNSIRIIKEGDHTLQFTDGSNEYGFNESKSVLMKRFDNMDILKTLSVSIEENPYKLLEESLYGKATGREFINTDFKNMDYFYEIDKMNVVQYPHIYLRLYSYKKGQKIVTQGDGLNKWNAKGRKRHPDEVAIRYSAEDKKKTPGFFPPRDISFDLILPDRKKVLSVKVCEQGDKTIQSKPNKDLGNWLLRNVFKLPEGTLVTYDLFEKLGIDCVCVEKLGDLKYRINFAKIGAYEEFMEDYRNSLADTDD